MLRFQWFNVKLLQILILTDGSVQIGGDNRKRALHVVDHVPSAGVDVAHHHPPPRVFAGIGGFSPEAENENLIERWSLRVHAPSLAWAKLGRIAQSFR